MSDYKYRARRAYEANRADEKLGWAAQMDSKNETDGPAFDALTLKPPPSHLSATAYIKKQLQFYSKTYRLGRRVGDVHTFQQPEEMLFFPLPITL